MTLTQTDVQHVAHLARLQLPADELEHMRLQLSAILDYMATLQEVNVEGVPPTANVTGLITRMRPDSPQHPLSHEHVLSNAPDTSQGMFRVKAILEET